METFFIISSIFVFALCIIKGLGSIRNSVSKPLNSTQADKPQNQHTLLGSLNKKTYFCNIITKTISLWLLTVFCLRYSSYYTFYSKACSR